MYSENKTKLIWVVKIIKKNIKNMNIFKYILCLGWCIYNSIITDLWGMKYDKIYLNKARKEMKNI